MCYGYSKDFGRSYKKETDRRPKARSTLSYAPDAKAAAGALAGLLDGPRAEPDPGLAPDRVRLVLGSGFRLPTDLTDPNPGSSSGGGADPPEPAGPPPAVPASSLQPQGIPCVK